MRSAATVISVFSLISLAMPFVAVAQDTTPINGLSAKIAQIIDPGASPGQVQVATLPAVIGWANDGSRYAFYQVCDNLPDATPQLSLSQRGLSVSERYRQFLMGVQAPVADEKADAAQMVLAKQASAVRKNQVKERKKALKDWDALQASERNLPEEQKTAFSTFMDGYADLQGYEISFNSILGRWQPLAAAAAPSSIGKNLNHFMDPAASQATVKTFSGATVTVYKCDPGIDLEKAATDAKSRTGKPPDLSIDVTHDTGQSNQSWEKWGGTGGWGPFSVDVHGTHNSVHTHDTTFHMTYTADLILRFAVTREWLNFTLIDTYKNSKPRAGSELAGIEPLWPHGSFPYVSREFIVAYHPHLSVTMGKADYDLAESSVTGGGSLSIGPFHVGADSASGSRVEKWDKDHFTIELGTSTDSFVLLGVVNREMP